MKRLKYKHFHADIILLNGRWYLAYPLSYRNLEEMMNDRGVCIDHTSIYRFSQDFQSLENSDSEAASWPEGLEDTPDQIPNYDIYEENQAQK